MIPKSYKVNDGCWNCFYVFTHIEYDEESILCCHEDKSIRPKCGSVAMGEVFGDILNNRGIERPDENYDIEYEKLMNEWYAWEKEHKVKEAGICMRHDTKEIEVK